MRLLAIDTSTTSCSVALLDGRRLVAEETFTDGKTHSRHLMSMIDNILCRCSQDSERLDGIAVTRGPGTFTGLRIGLSTVKGLAEAAELPVVGINSLAALAYPLRLMERPVVAMIDARRGEIYHAQFSAEVETSKHPVAVSVPDAAADSIPEGAVLVGSGALLYRSVFENQCSNVRYADDTAHIIRAASVGMLAMVRFESGEVDSVGTLVPEYVRKSDAQIQMSGSC